MPRYVQQNEDRLAGSAKSASSTGSDAQVVTGGMPAAVVVVGAAAVVVGAAAVVVAGAVVVVAGDDAAGAVMTKTTCGVVARALLTRAALAIERARPELRIPEAPPPCARGQ